MADNTAQGAADNIATDDITTMNGGTITAGTAKAQRMKIGYGADGFFRDVEPLFPLPIYDPDTIGSGTIAALNATVSVGLNSDSAMRVQITGTWVGTLQFEATVDGTNWIPINAVQAGSTTIPQNTTVNGVFSPTPSGFASFRVNATAWTSGTATVSIRTSSGAGGVYLNQYLPAFAVIPAFKIDQTTPGTTNLVAISGTVPVSGTFFQTTQPVSLTSTTLTGTSAVSLATLPALTAGAAVIGALTANQSVNNAQIGGIAPLMGNGVTGAGSQRVTIASDNTAFTVNTTPTTPPASIITSAATTNATSIKASAGTLYSITCSNAGAAAVFVKLYNLAAAPTVGTSSIALTIPIAASSVVTIPFGTQGMRFGTGIALAITNLVTEADATVVAANQVKVLTSYI